MSLNCNLATSLLGTYFFKIYVTLNFLDFEAILFHTRPCSYATLFFLICSKNSGAKQNDYFN